MNLNTAVATLNQQTQHIAVEPIARSALVMKHSELSNSLVFRLHNAGTPQARRLQSYIAQKYFAVHAAQLTAFMPQLIEMYDRSMVHGGIGIKSGDSGNFFLEQYLDVPIEQAIASIAKAPISRCQLVEIGNFAVVKKGMGSLLISILAKSLQQAGYRWMVFTATEEVERLIHRLGVKTTILAPARAERLSTRSNDWGNYYNARPMVMACELGKAICTTQDNKYLASLFDKYAESTSSLSQAFKSLAFKPNGHNA